jgi:threonine synthase
VTAHAALRAADESAGQPATSFECTGCGWRVPANEPVPLRCPAASAADDIDHVLARKLDPARSSFPQGREDNPFVRYRTLFHAWHAARELGWSDAEYVAMVERLDAAVAEVDGRGFRVTPFFRAGELSDRLGFSAAGGVWVKDETANVSGSHKARHLMGTLLELEVAEAMRRAGGELPSTPSPFAVASCGNAALAAAVIARAARRPLDVFIPPEADPVVVTRLRDLGARLTVCERRPGVRGDPTYQRLLEAVSAGALAFSCQGNLNGLAVEGGETLGWEMADTLAAAGARLDRVVVQVGGGALAAACAGGLAEARTLGQPIGNGPFHAVQTRGAYPLERAYMGLAARVAAGATPAGALAYAASHRSEFMWSWEEEPHSIAHGILDDETYDWFAVTKAMFDTGGFPIVVDEGTLAEANDLARSVTGIDVDPTGSAGLAGLLHLVRERAVDPAETVAVLFTGVRRSADSAAPAGPTASPPGSVIPPRPAGPPPASPPRPPSPPKEAR